MAIKSDMDLLRNNNDCREKIVSNEYADWVIDFELTEELRRLDNTGVDYCYRQVDRILGLVFAKRNQIEPIGLLHYSYQQIPVLLGLQKFTTEVATLYGKVGILHLDSLLAKLL